MVNALAFSGTKHVFSQLTDHGEEKGNDMIWHLRRFKGQGINGMWIE